MDNTDSKLIEAQNQIARLTLQLETLQNDRRKELALLSEAFAGSLRAKSSIERASDLEDMLARVKQSEKAPEEALKEIGHRYLENEANDVLTLSPADLYKKKLQALSASGDSSARIQHDLLSKNDISDKRKRDMMKAVKKNLG